MTTEQRDDVNNAGDIANALYLAGVAIGAALRCQGETYRRAAECPGLHPDYRAAIRLLADFRDALAKRGA